MVLEKKSVAKIIEKNILTWIFQQQQIETKMLVKFEENYRFFM